MKPFASIYFSLVTITAAIFCLSCDKAPKGDDVIITDQVLPKKGAGEAFIVDTASSWVRFTGHGVGKNHPGTFKLKYGKVLATDDKVTGRNLYHGYYFFGSRTGRRND